MATNDKESSAAGTDNRPPMLEESDFESCKIRIQMYIHGKPLGKLIWKSIKKGPTPHPTITVTTVEGEQQTQVTREKTDEEFTEAENNKERADIQATNILSQRLLRHIFNTLNQTETEKEIWENVELLIKMNQTSKNADPLAHMAQATQLTFSPLQYVPPPPQYIPAPQQAPQSTNDAMLATMNQIVNLLSGFQTQFPPTNNQLRTSTNQMTQATIQAGQITTESVQRRAPGNKGKLVATGSQGKVVTCYNCRGQGHVTKECKEKKRAKDSHWFKDKALLMEAKEKDVILDAEAEAFLAELQHMANLMQTGPSTGQGTRNDIDFHSEVQTYDNHFFDNMNLQVSQEIHMGEQPDSDVDSVIDDHDNTIPYHQYQLNNKVESVPTDVSSVIPGGISVITILDDLRSQLAGHIKANKEQSFANDSLKAELERYKTHDLHKSSLGHRNSLYLTSAQLCRPTLYLGDVIIDPVHTPFRVYDSEETLVQAEVSRTNILEMMKDPLCKLSSKPINYAKLNSLEKNLLIQNECLLAESVSKDICSVVLTSDIAVPMSVEPRSNCVKEYSRNLELEVEILKVKQLLVKKEKRSSFLETKYRELKLKFQKYKECFENPQSKAKSNSNISSGIAVPEKPKVLAPGLYAMTPKYVPPQKRNNREANNPLP
nr:hypothetical protein [Tanacetum cinerariifolium]